MMILFISGSSIDEIACLNPQFTLGQIVNAATENEWNIKKQEQIDSAVARAKDRTITVVAESVDFIADTMAAMHKKWSKPLKRYLQSGDDRELKDYPFGTLTTYTKMLSLLAQVTGQVKTVRHISEKEVVEEKAAEPQQQKSEGDTLSDLALLKKNSRS